MNKLILVTMCLLATAGCKSIKGQESAGGSTNSAGDEQVESTTAATAVAANPTPVPTPRLYPTVPTITLPNEPNCSQIANDCNSDGWGTYSISSCLPSVVNGQLSNWIGTHPPIPTESSTVISACKSEEAAAQATAQSAFLAPCVNDPCSAVLSICEYSVFSHENLALGPAGLAHNSSNLKECFTEAVYNQVNTNYQAIAPRVEALCLNEINNGRFNGQGFLDIFTPADYTCALPQYNSEYPAN